MLAAVILRCTSVMTIAGHYVSMRWEIHIEYSLSSKSTHLVGPSLVCDGSSCLWPKPAEPGGKRALYLKKSLSSWIDKRLVIEGSGILECVLGRRGGGENIPVDVLTLPVMTAFLRPSIPPRAAHTER